MVQPGEPAGVDVEGILAGMHQVRSSQATAEAPRVQLLASGVALPWALRAAELLEADYQVGADVWSVTSWNELRRDAVEAEVALMNGEAARQPYLTRRLQDQPGPVVAVSDFMRAVPDQIAPWVSQDFATLGTDGFGFSDTRAAARRWLKVDAASIVVKALQMLARSGAVAPGAAQDAFVRYRLDDVNAAQPAGSDDSLDQ
jgi:pyruvate dehydrogenase E1 component